MALIGRLQQVNPERTVVVGGEVRPALLVAENEAGICAEPPEAFCVTWGVAKPLSDSLLISTRLMASEVTIRYRTEGVNKGDGDRGRMLAAMDAELLAICSPQRTAKMDYTQATPTCLGTNIFWHAPAIAEAKQTANLLERTATTTVYFYPEGEA